MSGARETLHLWGAPAAGKTGVLGALYATSKSQEPDRWEAHPKDCRDPYTQEQLLDAYEQLHDRAVVKTDVRKDGYRALDFLLRQYRRGTATGATMRLSLVDPAGEYSTRTELGHTEHGRSLFARVAHSGGLLWLFSAADGAAADGAATDGAAAPLDRLVVLRHLVALLEQAGGAQLALPVGLCLSKIDALPPAQRDAALADPRAALLAHLGATTFTWFEAACPQLRCFAISSAGLEPGRVRPVGLLPMLSWFAGEIGVTREEPDAPAARTPAAPTPVASLVDHPAAADLATIEVPSVRAPRRGLAALAARFANAGTVPARLVGVGHANGDAPFEPAPDDVPDGAPDAQRDAGVMTTLAMPAVPRPLEQSYGPSFAPPLTPAHPAAAIPHAPIAPADVDAPASPDAASGDALDAIEAHDVAPVAGTLRERLVRAAASAGLVLAALGGGALVGRAAIRATAARWQPADARAAAAASRTERLRQMEEPEYRELSRDLQAQAARDAARRDSIDGEVAPPTEDAPPALMRAP